MPTIRKFDQDKAKVTGNYDASYHLFSKKKKKKPPMHYLLNWDHNKNDDSRLMLTNMTIVPD